MSSDFIGYNRQQVISLVDNIQNNYDTLYNKLTSGVQNGFVAGMTNAWICPDAVNFFNTEFTEAMRELVTDVNNIMRSVSEAINSSCEAYANQAGDTWARKDLTIREFQNYTITGVIKSYDDVLGQGGSRAQYEAAKDQLNAVKADCANATASITNASNQSGFIGADQQAALHTALQTIDTKISNGFADIITKTNNRVNDAITQFGAIGSGTTSAYSAR